MRMEPGHGSRATVGRRIQLLAGLGLCGLGFGKLGSHLVLSLHFCFI